MKTKIFVSFALLCVISLVLEACNYPGTPPLVPPTAQSNPQISVVVFTPRNNSVFSLAAPIGLVGIIGQLGASQPVITRREFLINGASIAATSPDLASIQGSWSPTHPGEYYVQGKITLRDGTTAISEPVRVCVVASLSAIAGVGGYLGPCPLPTQVPDHAASGDPAIFAVALPNAITFSTHIECPMALPRVTFIADVDDPQDLVALVMVNFSTASGGYAEFRYLNWVTTRPVNQKEYRTTVEINNLFSGDASIHWYVQAIGRNGEVLQRTQDFIGINQAQCSNQSLRIASATAVTSTLTSTSTATSTPTPGIVYIATPTRKPKKDNRSGNPAPAPTQPCNPLIKVCP